MEAIWHDILNYLNIQFGTLDWGLLLKQLTYDEKSPLIFSSGMFMCMFAVFIVIYTMLRHKSLSRTLFVLAFSYYFYYKSSGIYFFLLAVVTCSDYLIADVIYTTRSRWGRKLLVALSLIIDLGLLGFFKYTNFFGQLWSDISGAPWHDLNIFLPVGISFFTFQSLSYTIDVSRGKLKAERDFIRTALYIAFFPQLVAGPIVKAGDFLPQLREERNISLKNLEPGLQVMLFGLFKKIVIADNIASFVDAVHQAPAAYSAGTLMLCTYAYFVQLYCDFSGYSDMAVGCARCLGYDLPRNFNVPFLSPNVNEFWKRWHISLSAWLTEYLYFPLGGSRKGEARTCLNILINMTVCGLWHGSAWTFVFWGFLSGVSQCLYRLTTPIRKKLPKHPLLTALNIFLTFTFICFTAVIFRASDIGTAFRIIGYIFTGHHGIRFVSFWGLFGLALVWGAHIVALVRSKRLGIPPTGFYPMVKLSSFRGLLLFFLLAGITLALGYTGESPFIYFQF